MTSALQLRNVSKSFGALKVVDDVSLDVAIGERRAILGPNGAGKTTLFNVINGDIKASSGRICVFGEDVTPWPVAKRAKLGLRRTYQSSELFDSLTAEQNLSVALSCPNGSSWNPFVTWRSGAGIADRIDAVLEQMNLTHAKNRLAGNLSHGERRQLELGMAIAYDPKILLLDEPAAGLSEEERLNLVDLLARIDTKVTILMIEHDMRIALGFADYVSVLANGKMIAEGTPEEISNNELVQRVYIGEKNE